MSKAGERLLKSVRAARAYAKGNQVVGFVAHVPDSVDVKAVRNQLGLTQQAFALQFGFAYDAVRDWEAGRRQPERTARALLKVIHHSPDAVQKALAHF